jgi:hypothetical protein
MINPSVSIKLEVRQSDIPVKGNAMASGNYECDRKVENQILKRLENGDIAAWFDCVVTVSIEWSDDTDDYEYEGFDSLGGCSYNSFKEFIKQGSEGYYGDMLDQAWDSAIAEIANDDIDISTIVKPDLLKIKPVICEC